MKHSKTIPFPKAPGAAALCVGLLALLTNTGHAATPVPDGGQLSRGLPAPAEPALKADTTLQLEAAPVPTLAVDDSVRVMVKSVQISGNQVFATAELLPLVADLGGAERSFADLDAAAARITAYYRARGYALARAYLPAQDIQDGVVRMAVLEGKLAETQLSNRSALSDEQANRYLDAVKPGMVLKAETVEHVLLLLGDLPGVGAARAALQPGASVGTTDLLVELDPATPYVANLSLNNYGNRYAGEYLVDGDVVLNSPLGLGELFSLRAVSSDDLMNYARVGLQVPVGTSGLKVGASYAESHYKLGEEFVKLQAHGVVTDSSVYASYPLVRSVGTNVSGTFSLEQKDLIDNTRTSHANRQVNLATLGLQASLQDGAWGGGLTQLELTLTSGDLSLDAASLLDDAKPTSANTSGHFEKLGYSLSRLQRLGASETYSLWLSYTGQQASKNLGSSEKFTLGGASGVRAYPQGEGIGDQGQLLSLELRARVAPQTLLSVFYDGGSVDINRMPFAAGDNTRFISGAGLGLNGQLGRLQYKLSIAWRVSGGDPVSDTAKRDPRFWFQLNLPL